MKSALLPWEKKISLGFDLDDPSSQPGACEKGRR